MVATVQGAIVRLLHAQIAKVTIVLPTPIGSEMVSATTVTTVEYF